MEPITHILTGVTIGNLGFKQKRTAIAVAVFCSIFPDLDYFVMFWGGDMVLKYHRGITHGFFALSLVPLLIAFFLGRKKGFGLYFLVSFLAYGFHISLDLLTPYGTRLLLPLTKQSYSFDVASYVDPIIITILILGLLFSYFVNKRGAAFAYASLLLVSLYLGGRFYLHDRATIMLKNNLDTYVGNVYPVPNGFLRWWFVAKGKEDIKTGFVDLFTKRIYLQEVYPITEESPEINKSREARAVRNLLEVGRFPMPSETKENGYTVVKWRELAYAYLPGDHFVAFAKIALDGRIIDSHFKF